MTSESLLGDDSSCSKLMTVLIVGASRAGTQRTDSVYLRAFQKDLVEIAESPASKRRPVFLHKDFDT